MRISSLDARPLHTFGSRIARAAATDSGVPWIISGRTRSRSAVDDGRGVGLGVAVTGAAVGERSPSGAVATRRGAPASRAGRSATLASFAAASGSCVGLVAAASSA